MRRVVGVVMACVTVAGCSFGTITPARFQAEVQDRGGGFDQAVIVDAIGAVAAELGGGVPALSHLVAIPSAGVVEIEAGDPRQPAQQRTYSVRGGALVGSDPVEGGEARAGATFTADDVALDRLNEMADATVSQLGAVGGHVTSLVIDIAPADASASPQPVIVISVESPHSAAVARFAATGDLIAFDPAEGP